MNFLKKTGCPNCKTEKCSEVWSKSEFYPFKKLTLLSVYGKSTELFECGECKNKYICVNKCHLLHRLSPKSEKTFFSFFESSNILSEPNKKIIDQIGSPSGIVEYPGKIKTKSGQIFEHAVIKLSDSIWPVSLADAVHFLSEIEEVSPSDEAMTLLQRQAAYEAPEIRMGVSPIWLKHKDKVYMTNYSQYFIPLKCGNPSDFSIEPGIMTPKPTFEVLPVTYFLGPT